MHLPQTDCDAGGSDSFEYVPFPSRASLPSFQMESKVGNFSLMLLLLSVIRCFPGCMRECSLAWKNLVHCQRMHEVLVITIHNLSIVYRRVARRAVETHTEDAWTTWRTDPL